MVAAITDGISKKKYLDGVGLLSEPPVPILMQISSEKCYFCVHEIKHKRKFGNFSKWKIKTKWLLSILKPFMIMLTPNWWVVLQPRFLFQRITLEEDRIWMLN